MQLSTHLGFDGNCAEAMEFYTKTFGGSKQFSMTWGDSPMCDQVAEADRGKIMHYSIKVGETTLMAADSPTGRHQKPQGIVVSIAMEDLEKAKQVFEELAAGGSVQMPFAETFWAKGFGMCTDRYSIPWMVNCEKPMDAQAG